MMPFSLFLALKYLRPKRSFISIVTIVSVVGVLLGVAILVIVLSVMTGFDDMWREKILSFKPHLTVSSAHGVLHDEENLCKQIEAVPGVIGVAPVIETLALVQYAGAASAPIVIGLDPERAAGVSKVPFYVRRGSFDLEGEKALVGLDMAYRMQLPLGGKMLVYSPQNVTSKDELYLPEELTVSGVFDLGMRDFDSRFILTSLQVARDLVGMEEGAHSIYIMLRNPFQFEVAANQIRRTLGPGFIVRTWKEIDSLMFQALSHEKGLMGVLLGIITVVAIFCVTNTLIVITVQKTNEIGLLKALGFSSWQIMTAFVLHGWIQCLLGTVLGIGTGFLVLFNLSRIAGWLAKINVNAFPKEIYGLSELPWRASGVDIAWIAVFVIVVCTLSSLVPACRAATLDPVRALRKE
jgi:lipoprotein-releasing system permease protein